MPGDAAPIERSPTALGWPELTAAIASRAASAPGQVAAAALGPLPPGPEWTARRALVAELWARAERREPGPPLGELTALDEELPLLVRGGTLDASQLRHVLATARCAVSMSEWRDELPGDGALATHLAPLADLGELARAIEAALEPDGSIKDSASWDLVRLRGRRRDLQRLIQERLHATITTWDQQGLLNDTFYTVRAGRYVLPVKSELRGRVEGILHDLSQSQQSAFIEPSEVIGQGNQLVAVEAEIREEERRVLAQLSAACAAQVRALGGALDLLTGLDALAGAVRLFTELGGCLIEPGAPAAGFALAALRHPLLALRAGAVVANTVALEPGTRVLVITGPNAGGKTVLLSALGLAALCQRAALPCTVGPGSRLPIFEAVLVSLGDRQSLADGHSTFSAHMAEIAAFLRRAQAAGGGALVLLDELVADTEPAQGAALARAIAEALADTGALLGLTTHYGALKLAAAEDQRFLNLAMGYDDARGRPTFAAHSGDAGSSNPLSIAAREGLPPALLARAAALAGEERLEPLLAQLRAKLAQAQSSADAAAAAQAALERERHSLTEHRARYERSRQQIEDAVRFELAEQIQRVRRRLSGVIGELQAQTTNPIETMRAAQRGQVALASLERELQAPAAPAPEAVTAQPLRAGQQVRVAGMGEALFTIERIDERRGTAEVRRERLRAQYPLRDLHPAGEAQRAAERRLAHARSSSTSLRRALLASPAESAARGARAGPTLDLRGLRVEEAVRECERFLDAHFDQGLECLTVIHGHGTGALKEAVRSYLAASPYVASWRRGEQEEGGDGVAIVTIRA